MKDPDLSAYEAWLEEEGYQPSTRVVTLRHMRTIASEGKAQPYQHAHVRRYLRFVQNTRLNPMGRAFKTQMQKNGLTPSGSIRKAGKRSKRLLTDQQWSQLRAKLRRAGDDVSKLLIAYMHSPYQISEFLDLWVRGVGVYDIDDKLSRDWIDSTPSPKNKKLHMLLCETPRCAYYRLRCRLQEVTEKIGFDADLNTLFRSYRALYGEKAA